VYKSKRHRLELTRNELKTQRQPFESIFKEVGENFFTNRPIFDVNSDPASNRQNKNIIDNTPKMAARTLANGMMSGITSPSRNWKRLTVEDPDLAEFQTVKDWLFKYDRLMSGVFLKSNLYTVLPLLYKDLGTYATGAIGVEEDFRTTLNATYFPFGSYWIANDSQGRVRVFHREFRMTVRQVVEKFGVYKPKTGVADWSTFSKAVKSQYDNSNYGAVVNVCHAIEPNQDWDPKSLLSKDKAYTSCYYELNTRDGEEDKFLRERGYDEFPVLVARWQNLGDTAWGDDSPGLTSIGDAKQLQFGEKMGLKGLEKNMDPPLVGPPEMENTPTFSIPGKITFGTNSDKLRALYEINPRLGELENKQQQVRNRIDKAFFVDLMLRITNDERAQRATAQEIVAGKEEQWLALGTVFQQVDKDLLTPIVGLTSSFLFALYKNDKSVIPEPPQELQGMDLKVEYQSTMAQAQKLVGISSMQRFVAEVQNVSSMVPGALKKFDAYQYLDEMGETLGVSPRILRSDDAVAALEQAEQQAQQAQAQAQMIQQAAGAAKDLGQAKVGEGTALDALLGGGQ
jgi:hypothetical protein